MPLFTIRREIPGLSREELDAAAYRAIMCAFEFPGMRWVRSYWDAPRGEITCLYEARDAEQIRDHAHRSRIPCDEVREVIEVAPEQYVRVESEKATGTRG
jgi:hypothetical protein